MKKIMILGASILQLPAIIKAKEMGLQVIAVDMDEQAIGFKYADICLPISTIDIPRVVEAAVEYEIDGVMTLASDMPMRTVAAVSKELGVCGIDEQTAINATNKAEMRKCLGEHGVPIPRFYKVSNENEYYKAVDEFKDAFIVKPADNSGSRGIYLINDITDKEAIEKAYSYSHQFSRSGDVVIEEYMRGPEVSVETLSVDGECHVIQITDKLTTGSPHFVEMGHNEPSLLPQSIKERIAQVTVAAVNAIGIMNGPSHTEIIVTKDGPKIVELGARLGGDNITTHLVPLSTGVNMVECCIKIALGEQPDMDYKYHKASAIRYFDVEYGKIRAITGIDEARKIPGVQQVFVAHDVGETMNGIESSVDRAGFVIAQASNVQEAIDICNTALDKINIEINV